MSLTQLQSPDHIHETEDPVSHWLNVSLIGILFALFMIWEGNRWPNGTALLGPIGLVWSNGLSVSGLAVCAVSGLMLFAFVLKPHPITATISLLGGAAWLFMGIMAQGIGC